MVSSGFLSDIANSLGSTGLVTVDGTGSTWDSGHLDVGHYGNAELQIKNGGVVTSGIAQIGDWSGSTGKVTVEGNGSRWTTSDDLDVGNGGDGTLIITEGGVVDSGGRWNLIGGSIGKLGVVTVDGNSSRLTCSGHLTVGNGGSGTLSITSGGAVSNYRSYIGHYAGSSGRSTGHVTVDGNGSTWTNNDDLYVGCEGDGMLNITSGGSVDVSGDTLIAQESGSTGEIHFNDGTLSTGGLACAVDGLTGTGTINTHGLVSDVDLVFNSTYGTNQILTLNDSERHIMVYLNVDGSGSMGAGYGGTGTVSISDGSAIQSTDGYIGYKAGSSGTVTVDGTGSLWTSSDHLYIGRNGDGTLAITDSGEVNSYWSYIGYKAGSSGTVTVDGADSTWTNTISFNVGYRGDGTLTITNGGTVNSRGGSVGAISGSTSQVIVDGVGSTWTSRGNSFYVGRKGTGILTITGGGLVSFADTLTIDYDTDGDSFIKMGTGGMLALASDDNGDDSLDNFLSLIDGTDAIRYWDFGLADWVPITSATYGDDYTLEYLTTGDLAGYTILTVGMAGDFDGDSNVDGADFLAWQRGELPNPLISSDLDNWRMSCGSSSSTSMSTPVPEPATASLFILAAASILLRWQRLRTG